MQKDYKFLSGMISKNNTSVTEQMITYYGRLQNMNTNRKLFSRTWNITWPIILEGEKDK